MISKFINWTWKPGKYQSMPALAGAGLTNDYRPYLNYLSEAKVIVANGGSATDPTNGGWRSSRFTFKQLCSYKRQYVDNPDNAGALTGILNLLNPGITKTMTCPVVEQGATFSGFRLQTESSGGATNNPGYGVNAVVIQLNKFDRSRRQGLDYIFEYIQKPKDSNSLTATNAKIYRVIWRHAGLISTTHAADVDTITAITDSITIGGNESTATGYELVKRMPNTFNEGLFLVDYDIIKRFQDQGVDNVPFAANGDKGFNLSGGFALGATDDAFTYSFNFYAYAATSSISPPPKLEVANITLTNALSVYVDGSVKSGNKNLNAWNFNKKTGIAFPEINEFQKSFDGKMSLLTLEEQRVFNEVYVKNNKDCPFYFFPYCEATRDLSPANALTDLKAMNFQKENIDRGGLWIFDPSYDITNSVYDIFDLPLKLDEYK